MNSFEKAEYIHAFFDIITKSSTPATLAEGLKSVLSYNESNKALYERLRHFITKHKLVDIVDREFGTDTFLTTSYTLSESGLQLYKDEELTTFIIAEDFKEEHPEMYDEKVWDDYFDSKIEKRAEQADFFFDIIVSEKLLKLDKPDVRKYFKQWFKETQEFDLQIKNGDLAIEDGSIQLVPDFDKSNIPEFIKWFESQKDDFVGYLRENGITSKTQQEEKSSIVNNSGNLIINNSSTISNQSIHPSEKQTDTGWTKTNVIVAIVVGVATIIGVIWGIVKG